MPTTIRRIFAVRALTFAALSAGLAACAPPVVVSTEPAAVSAETASVSTDTAAASTDTAAASPDPGAPPPCCLAEGRLVTERHRVAAIDGRRFTHAELWAALDPLVRAPGLRVQQVGASVHGRPIRAVTFGSGPTTVLLWSQMHGDESTATMALADILAWMAAPDAVAGELKARLARELTIVMVPMLNPDGAEIFQRHNAFGVDVNRDAVRLATPEARTLKGLRDSLRPEFGFNLHDQGARIISGREGRQVGIALLAPAADERLAYDGARGPARLLTSEIAEVVAQVIPGRIAKYEDSFNPRAFGDLMQQWGTSTVLIESGALPDDPEKQQLRAVNVVALLTAFDAIATERWRAADPNVYNALPMNDRSAVDVLVRGAQLVLPGAAPARVDVAINYENPLTRTDPRVREVGDLSVVVALDTVDAAGLFLHPAPAALHTRENDRRDGRWLRIGAPAAFTLRRGPEPTSAVVREVGAAREGQPR